MTQRRQLCGSGSAGDSRSRLSSSVLSDFAFRVLPSCLREDEFNFEETKINKIFASHWLNERQIVMGTKCNKLLVFDVSSHQVSYIPMLKSSGRYQTADPPCGIHAISINPSNTLLATGGHSTNDIAIYQLPTFDPVAVCENGHQDWVFGIDWIDDEFFVSGSRDSNICLYRVQPDAMHNQTKPHHSKSHSKSSSSHPVSSVHYQYLTSESPHVWTTIPTRASRGRDPAASTTPSESRFAQRVFAESDSDESSENESGERVEVRFPSSLDELLHLQRISTSLSSLRERHLVRRNATDRRDGDEDEDEEEEGDDDDDEEEDENDGVASVAATAASATSRSRGGPTSRRQAQRPLLTASRRLRSDPENWDMDEIEDEQSEESLSSTPRERRVPPHPCITPLDTLNCDRAEKVRAVSYNKWHKQVATLSLNAFFHLIDVNTFRSVGDPLRLPHPRENVCMSVNEDGSLFAIGSQSHVTFVDPRVPKINGTRSIVCKQRGCGIRSLSFKNDLLTFGTGQGSVYFYDIRADKYLELFCGAPVQLEAGMGWLFHDDTYHDFFDGHEYPNAIYTHCYDPAGTRLFTAGGPLPAGLFGNYAALWH